MASSKRKRFESISVVPTEEELGAAKTSALQSIVEGTSFEHKQLNVGAITYNPENDYRNGDADDEIEELARDIQRNGLLHNIVVSYHADTGEYLLLSGERRLRAYKKLAERYPADERWGKIYAQVRKELSPLQELIILDAANLEARGSGANDEARYRKAITRFVENVQREFSLSEGEAVKMTAAFTGASTKLISRNLDIEAHLLPGLTGMLDAGKITKNMATAFSSVPQDEQAHIQRMLDGYFAADDAATASEFGNQAVEAIRRKEPVAAVKVKSKKGRDVVAAQKEKLHKSCARIDGLLDDLMGKAALIRTFDEGQDAADNAASIGSQLAAIEKKLARLRDMLS